MFLACATSLCFHQAEASLAGFLTMLRSWATSGSLGYNEQTVDAQTEDIGGLTTASALTETWLSPRQQARKMRRNLSMPITNFERTHTLKSFFTNNRLDAKTQYLTSFHIVSLLSGRTL